MNAENAPHGVLMLRSQGSSDALTTKLTAQRIPHYPFIVTDIKPVSGAHTARPSAHPDLLVFLSHNAVRFGTRILEEFKTVPTVAIGHSTAGALRAVGRDPQLIPDDFSSEGLIAALSNHPRGTHIGLVCGRRGRQVFETHAERCGFRVTRFEVYERLQAHPPLDALTLVRTGLLNHQFRLTTATSVELLQHAVALINTAEVALQSLPVVCLSARIRTAAETMGFTKTFHADPSDQDAFIAELARHWRNAAN